MTEPSHVDLARACEIEATKIVAEYVLTVSSGSLLPFNMMHNADVLLRIAARLREIENVEQS